MRVSGSPTVLRGDYADIPPHQQSFQRVQRHYLQGSGEQRDVHVMPIEGKQQRGEGFGDDRERGQLRGHDEDSFLQH